MSNETVALAAAQLTRAIIAAQAGAKTLPGLTDDGAVMHTLGIYDRAYEHIVELLADKLPPSGASAHGFSA